MTEENKRKRLDEKRGGQDGSEVVDAKSKRQKISSTLNDSSTVKRQTLSKAQEFRHFHLILLQSLYAKDKDNGDAEDFSSATAEDDEVEDHVWLQAKKFLNEREKLMEEKNLASNMKDVHQEAMMFMEENSYLPATAARSPPPRTVASGGSSWHNLTATTSAFPLTVSPQSTCMFSPLRSTGPSQQFSHGADNSSGTKCFGLVESLLKRRFRNIQSSARRRSDPYKPLLETVETKISVLNSKVKKSHEEKLLNQRAAVEDLLAQPVLLSSSQTSFLNDPMEFLGGLNGRVVAGGTRDCSTEKLEAKLKLWSTLADALKEII